MQKTINRKICNTETATKIGTATGGQGEFRFKETLYQSNRGDFFIHGKGGKATRWNGVESIIGVNEKAVKTWRKIYGIVSRAE